MSTAKKPIEPTEEELTAKDKKAHILIENVSRLLEMMLRVEGLEDSGFAVAIFQRHSTQYASTLPPKEFALSLVEMLQQLALERIRELESEAALKRTKGTIH